MLAYFVSLAVLVCLRLYLITPRARAAQSKASALAGTCSLAVFLGSGMETSESETICIYSVFIGGHTSEVLKLLSDVDFSRYTPRTYIISEGDNLSAQKAMALESSKVGEDASRVCVFLCAWLVCILIIEERRFLYLTYHPTCTESSPITPVDTPYCTSLISNMSLPCDDSPLEKQGTVHFCRCSSTQWAWYLRYALCRGLRQ